MKNAVVLFSGGLDSTTCLCYAQQKGFNCYALSFNYNQKHSVELKAAKMLAQSLGVEHIVVDLPIAQFGNSALTAREVAVPDYDVKEADKIPITYVPARNTIFLAFALGWAEALQANDIFVGVSAIDYSNYPDCRPDFIQAFEKVANLATKVGVESNAIRIHTPLINLSKAETIQLGLSMGIDYQNTISCYRADAQGKACGTCHSCTLRKKGFTVAGIPDPTYYV